jgi:hypothetical protein
MLENNANSEDIIAYLTDRKVELNENVEGIIPIISKGA